MHPRQVRGVGKRDLLLLGQVEGDRHVVHGTCGRYASGDQALHPAPSDQEHRRRDGLKRGDDTETRVLGEEVQQVGGAGTAETLDIQRRLVDPDPRYARRAMAQVLRDP